VSVSSFLPRPRRWGVGWVSVGVVGVSSSMVFWFLVWVGGKGMTQRFTFSSAYAWRLGRW
jgi:hypothetical protein